MPTFKENPSPIMQKDYDPDSMVVRSKATAAPGTSVLQKRSGFKMKYQGNPSAFPFKGSPMKSNGGGHGDHGVYSTETSPNPKDPPTSPRVKKPPYPQD